MRVAYICNRYPAISMTFVRREVEGLRRLGVSVKTMSIRPPLKGDLLSVADREVAGETYSVLPVKLLELLRAHLRASLGRPLAYLRTLAFSLSLSPGGARGLLWRLFYFAEAIAVWDRCRRERIRHVHSHFANVATDVAMLCVEFADRPGERWSWSFTLHGPVEFYDVYRAQLAVKIARARFVICISDFARSQAMAWSEQAQWQKLHVVHCGVDPVSWSAFASPPDVHAGTARPSSSGAVARADGRDRSKLRVLCVGRLIALKGHAVLIEAAALLREQGVEMSVVLVGDGAARGSLEALASELGVAELIEFAGSIGQDRIREFFARVDVFCLPSFAEGVPVVLMEAMAMELPVLSTRIMGIPELIEDERSGLLVAPGRPDELAVRLRRLADSSELRRRLGRAGREKVLAEYDIASSAASIEELLRRYGVGVDAPRTAAAIGSAAAEPPVSTSLVSGTAEGRSLALQNAGPPPGKAGAEV